MTKKRAERDVVEERANADRLRRLTHRLRGIGKRGLLGTFTAGEMLEEASQILRGSFSSWVKTECGLEARTALGFRKTFLVLGKDKDKLVEMNVAPSVAVLIACAKPEGRERALGAIASGRSLTVAEAKRLVKGDTAVPTAKPSTACESSAQAPRSGADRRAAGKQDLDGREIGTTVAAIPAPSKAIASTTSAFRHGMTAFEICAGAGGQAAGLAQAGFRHVGLLERNSDACRTLRAAFGPDHVIEADLVGYRPEGIEGLDLLAGGVPCTPFSQAGAKKGASDDRDMFPEALRLVKTLRPRAIMLENVTGIFAPDNDIYRFGIQAELKRMGYASEWRKVDASHFGVPQKRVRAILVAFREKAAMARFVWPTALIHYADEPYPVIAALIDQIESRGYVLSPELHERMNRAATTLLGGSELKQGADLGQRKGSIPWMEMGFIRTRIADEPPAADHVGDIALTNKMLATIQGFPSGWPLRGKKVPVFKQIVNAFPPPVAMHLGCAIASALAGEFMDPGRQYSHFARSTRHVAWRPARPELEEKRVEAFERARQPKQIQIPMAALRAGSDVHGHSGLTT